MTQSLNYDQLAQALTRYIPPAVVRAMQARQRPQQEPLTEQFDAAILFADVSGFTTLTEKLAARGPAGAEELTLLLNRYFTRMINILESEGGEVVQFSGDALMASFPADLTGFENLSGLAVSVRRAWQAATQMQAAMSEFATLATSAGAVELGMKIAIGAGKVFGFSVGGLRGRWQYLIAGDPLRQVSEAEHQAQRGDVVLSAEAQALLSTKPLPPQPLPTFHWHTADAETIALVSTHVPYAIKYRLQADQADWLAELRRLSIVFFGVGGLDYAVPGAVTRVQQWIEACQQAVYHYEGSLNKLLVDDKGTIGIMLFGAPPFSHEDDPLRAVRCAFEMQQAAAAQQLHLAVGVTTGQVFVGPVGSETRREYTVMGDAVNLAARLMQLAGRGHICADYATYQATRASVAWEILEPQRVKGKAAPVQVYQPLGLQSTRATTTQGEQLIGRDAELAQLDQALERLTNRHGGIICIEGEAGMGTSRLVRELIVRQRERGLVSLLGSGDAVEQQMSYNGWREIYSNYFSLETVDTAKLTDTAAVQQQQRELVLARLNEIAPALRERAPLLNDLLGLGLPETDLTRPLDPRLRQASLSALLTDLLSLWAEEHPLVVLIEDAQWLDSLSWQLALQVARIVSDVPVLLVLALRPLDNPPTDHPYIQIGALPQCQRLSLAPLNADDVAKLVSLRLGVRELPAEVAQLIVQRANGNPFVAEELALSLREQQAISIVDGECVLTGNLNELHVPETLHSLVLSTLDRLPPREQITLKIASVIGRTFGYATLRDIYQPRVDEDQLQASLEQITRSALIQTLPTPSFMRTHAFKQAITQEVTYSTLLQTQYRELHARAAQWYETYLTAGQKELYPLLAYHWRQADHAEKELRYAALAGKELAAEYANHEALGFLNRALQLTTDPKQRTELLWLCLDVHERLGDRRAQQQDLQQLQALAEQQGNLAEQARVGNAWGDYYRNLSDYPAALNVLQHSRTQAQQAHDLAAEARSLTLWGQVLEHQGQYPDAKKYFEQALVTYQRLDYKRGEGNNLNRLSSISGYLGDYQTAKEYALKALDIRRATHDKAGEITSLTNLQLISTYLGDVKAARAYQQEALQIARVIGDRAGEAFSLATIGNDCLTQGDYAAAQHYLQQALRLFRMMGERRREASCLNTLGAVWREVGDNQRARNYFEQALAIQLQTGSRSFVVVYTYLNLGLARLPTDPPAAHTAYQNALALARELSNRGTEAFALSYLGGFAEHQRDWEAARQDYEASLAIRNELKATAPAIEDIAGLARVAFARGDLAEAHAHAETCITHLREKGVAGIEFPLVVYLTCYDVLRATGADSEARAVLADAHTLLLKRADAISDAKLRASMVQNVAANRRVMAEWAQRNG